MMVEDVKFKNTIFFTARITNTLITILAFYTMDRTILVALALIVVGDVITVVMALMRMKRFPNPLKADLKFAVKIVPFGIVSMITTLMLTLNYRVDTLMMGYMYRHSGCGDRLLYAGRVALRIWLADSGRVSARCSSRARRRTTPLER